MGFPQAANLARIWGRGQRRSRYHEIQYQVPTSEHHVRCGTVGSFGVWRAFPERKIFLRLFLPLVSASLVVRSFSVHILGNL